MHIAEEQYFELKRLRAEVEALKATPPDQREDLRCVIADVTRQCQEARAKVEALRADAASVIRECGNALSEELAAYDIEPPIHHIKQASERCAEWLAKHDAARAAQGDKP